MKVCRRAINFDLRISDLKKYFDETNPNYAYALIEKYMESHGFEHRQYSGYVSKDELTDNQLISFTIKMSNKFDWLHKCLLKCDSTDISNLHDLIGYFELPYKMNDDTLILCDSSNEYKLYLNHEGLYKLTDEDENEVGITDYDNIEDALDDIKQQNNELEL